MEIGFHGTVDEDVGGGGEGRKKEKKNKEDGVWGKGRGRGGIRKRQKKTRLDGVDEARGKGEGWLKQILNGQPQADIAFL